MWKAKNTLAFTHPKLKIGIGYTPFISNMILYNDINFDGIDLNTGNTIWKRPIRHENGLDDIVMLNDTVAIIISSGLHTVNLKTGLGWDYNAKTGDFQLMKRDIRSNLIRDSLNLYFASKEKISCIDLDGKVVWSTQLPENITSRSIITIMDSTLFMINTGSIKLDYAVVKQGKPFLAAFDLKDGCKKFLCTVDEKKGKIIESIVRDERLLILYKDKIAYSSIKDGQLIDVKSFDTKIYGEIIGFIGLNIFNKFDLAYKSIALSDNENYYLYTNKNKVLAISKDLNIVKEYNTDDLYNYYLKYKNLRFLTSKKGTVVINDDNIIVAKI